MAKGHAGAPDASELASAAVGGKGSGAAVPASVRSRVEPAVGADLSHVRVHGDPGSRQATAAMGARAFAHGGDVFLGPGESADDAALMAHELTHTVQQQGGSPRPQRKVAVGEPGSAAEHEADAVADHVAAGAPNALVVENGLTQPNQMTRSIFLVELERLVKTTAAAALGPEWQAAGCPYIEQWFAAHQSSSAADLERLARRYSGITAKAARDYLPPIGARLSAGIAKWRAGGDVAGDLAAAGLTNAASAAHVGPPVTAGKPVTAAGPAAQRKLTTEGGSSPAAVAHELGPGQALDGSTADRMGDAFGHSFGHVRVHTGEVAARKSSELGARAFTVGSNIAFAPGAYRPGTPTGDALLAHELAHVQQQRRAGGDPAAANAAVGAESAAAERDADGATRGAVARLADPTKAAPRADVAMDTGFQLQRCSKDDPTIATGALKGQWEGKVVAKQKGWASPSPIPVDMPVPAIRTLGTPQQSEAAALALVQTNGGPGAVTLENGQYVAYETQGMVSGGTAGNTTFEEPRCEPGVVALVTNEHAVQRPREYDPGAKGLQNTDASAYKKGSADPFQGYKDALAGGKDLEGADSKVLVPAFEAAMRDTALSALAESERAVREKKPKFDKGLGGVPDAEVALIRDTAAKLLPIQKALDAAKQKKDAGLSLAHSPGGGALAAKYIEQANKDIATYGPQRNAIRQAYPMLARFSTDELEKFTAMSDEQRVQRLGGEFPGILTDIEKTRNNLLVGKIDLWESPEIIEVTMQGLGITSKDKRQIIEDQKKSHERGKTITNVIKAILSIGLGIGAVAIGGPVGAAMAVGVLASDVLDAVHDTDQYFVNKAASNTDVDPNKSIMNPDDVPGWGWLIVSWAAVGLDILDVKAAVVAIQAGAKTPAKAAEELGHAHAGLKGMSEGELVSKLKTAAGELKAGEVLTELNKGGVVSRMGVSIEIDKSIAETEVRVGYKVDKETGKVEVTGMRVGAKATIEDVLAHQTVIKLIRRYEGATGKIRQLWDKLRSLGGKTPSNVNPFPPGSQAYNSWFEVKKLPAMIEARSAKYGPHLTKEAEAALRQDVEFLETELANHQKVVDQMILEAGGDYIAKVGDSTLLAVNERGYSLPDVAKKPPLDTTDIANSSYYYRLDDGKPTLVRKADKPGKSLRPEIGSDGKPTGKFLEGELSRAEKADAVVASMPKAKQDAFHALVEKIQKLEPSAKVVPIEAMAATKKSIAQITAEFGDKAFKEKLTRLVTQALEKKGLSSVDAAAAARKAVDSLMSHEILVVKGTDQLRAFGYRPRYMSATGQVVEDDLHHMIPLYLGGDHTVGNLLDIDAKLHDGVHELVESVRFGDGVSLAPSSIQNAKELTFSQGAAILHADGTITYDTLTAATK